MTEWLALVRSGSDVSGRPLFPRCRLTWWIEVPIRPEVLLNHRAGPAREAVTRFMHHDESHD